MNVGTNKEFPMMGYQTNGSLNNGWRSVSSHLNTPHTTDVHGMHNGHWYVIPQTAQLRGAQASFGPDASYSVPYAMPHTTTLAHNSVYGLNQVSPFAFAPTTALAFGPASQTLAQAAVPFNVGQTLAPA